MPFWDLYIVLQLAEFHGFRKQLMGVEYMKKVTLKWKVAKKPERTVQKAASHFTFKSCTVKCGE